MKLRILVFLSLFMALPAFGADFGIGLWGDSRDTVLSDEIRINVTPIGQFDYLVYETSLGNIENIQLVYRFKDDKLVKGVFIFKINDFSPENAITQYETIKGLISQKYGNPSEDSTIWALPPGPENRIEWAQYLKNNQLILQSEWQNNETIIRHQLSEYNEKLHHQLVYQPIESKADSESLF